MRIVGTELEERLEKILVEKVLTIGNSFSLQMLPENFNPEKLHIVEVDKEEFRNWILWYEHYGMQVESALGHDSTVNLYNQVMDARMWTNRKNVSLEGEVLFVFQISGRRPEEGKIYTEEELKEFDIRYFIVWLED